ncbi:hypothetical protein DMX12_15810 [Pseudomonas sp. MB-090624]|nr:hypothetical protein DMX12_15810 [Pseudomonas sp. MB-090624]
MSRKGREAAPAIYAAKLKSWGRFAPLSRHKAAPTLIGVRRPLAARDSGLRVGGPYSWVSSSTRSTSLLMPPAASLIDLASM